jgi:hypothetical protein
MFMGLVAAALRRAHPDTPPSEISTRWLRPASRPAEPPAGAASA